MPHSDLDAQASSFGVAAAAYQRSRPSYPAEAVTWLLPPGARSVVDVGAGTGTGQLTVYSSSADCE